MKRLLLALGVLATLFAIVTAEIWFIVMPPSVRAQTNTFCASNLACTVTGIWSFGTYSTTGSGTHSGTETFANITSQTIASNDGVSPNLVTLDFRGTTIPSDLALGKTIAYNVTTGGNTDSMVREQMTVGSVPSGGAVLSRYSLTSLFNGTGSSSTIDGVSTEGQVTGTLSGTQSVLTGNEMVASIFSTGGTVSYASGGLGYVYGSGGASTAITNAYGLWGRGCNGGTFGTAPTNCYGAYMSTQSGVAGGTRRYSFGSEGVGLFLYDSAAAKAGFDCEDASHLLATPHCFYIANDNSLNLQAINTAGINLSSVNGVTQLHITNSGATIGGNPVAVQATLTLKKGSGAGNYTTASTTYVVPDSTNLCFTVTIPTGWKLGIQASGSIGTSTAIAAASAALTDNAACSTANAGLLVESQTDAGVIGGTAGFSLSWVITGDGAAHNIALQVKTAAGADSVLLLNSSATATPTMKFELMPSN